MARNEGFRGTSRAGGGKAVENPPGRKQIVTEGREATNSLNRQLDTEMGKLAKYGIPEKSTGGLLTSARESVRTIRNVIAAIEENQDDSETSKLLTDLKIEIGISKVVGNELKSAVDRLVNEVREPKQQETKAVTEEGDFPIAQDSILPPSAGDDLDTLAGELPTTEVGASPEEVMRDANSLNTFIEQTPSADTLEPPTWSEAKDTLRSKVLKLSELSELAEKISVDAERNDMQEKEQAYLAAFKELEKKRTFANRLFKRKDLKAEEARVEEFKQAFNESRVIYANAVDAGKDQLGVESNSFTGRMERRFQKLQEADALPLGEGGTPISLEEYLQNSYEERKEKVSSYIQFREVIRPLAEKKLQMRLQALGERDRNSFQSTLGWVGSQNKKLEAKVGKTGARAIRALASTVVIALPAAALGSFGAGATIGMIGGWAAYKFSKSFFAAVAGAAAGGSAAEGYEQFYGRGRQQKAAAGIVHEGKGEAVTAESLERLDSTRDRLAIRADEMTLQKNKAYISAAVAFLFGAGTAATLMEIHSFQNAAEGAGNVTLPLDPSTASSVTTELTSEQVEGIHNTFAGGASTDGHQVPALPQETGADTSVAPATASAKPPVEFGNLLKGAVINVRGEGMSQLFVDLRQSLNADPDLIKHPSPALEHVLKSNPNALTHEIHAAVDGESAIMRKGDQFLVDENQNVWFQAEGKSPQLLFENDREAPGGYVTHDIKWEMRPDGATAPERVMTDTNGTETESTPHTQGTMDQQQSFVPDSPSVTEDPSDALNRAQVTSHGSSPYPADETAYAKPSADPAIVERAAAFSEIQAQDPGRTMPLPQEKLASAGPRESGSMTLDEFNARLAEVNPTEQGAAAIIQNHFGVTVDLAHPAGYEWRVPGTKIEYPVAVGGTPGEASAWARAQVLARPNSTFLFNTPVRDPLTGVVTNRIDAWSSNAAGTVELVRGIVNPDITGALPPINPEDVTRKLP